MDRCVKSVMADSKFKPRKGKTRKESAIAVCFSSISGKAEMGDHLFSVPITKIDEKRRIISGIATGEQVDRDGEVVGYEASKKAFSAWRGNIREMHQPSAVGKALSIVPDDKKKEIHLSAFISRGAPDTWQKIKEGVLSYFSIGGRKVTVEMGDYKGKRVPHIKAYKLAEVSVVDSGSYPQSKFEIVKMDKSGEVIDVQKRIGRLVTLVEMMDRIAMLVVREDCPNKGSLKRAFQALKAAVDKELEDTTATDYEPVEEGKAEKVDLSKLDFSDITNPRIRFHAELIRKIVSEGVK